MKRTIESFRKSLIFLQAADFRLAESDPYYRSGVTGEFVRTFELAWKSMQAVLDPAEGSKVVRGSPRSIIRAAYAGGLVDQEEAWLEMLGARNHALHVYDAESGGVLLENITARYLPAMTAFLERLDGLQAKLPPIATGKSNGDKCL